MRKYPKSSVKYHLYIKIKEFKLCSKKLSEQEIIKKAVKTIIQILYDKGVSDNYENADEVLKEYLLKKRKTCLNLVKINKCKYI